MSTSPNPLSRTRYHHGDLRNALSAAALELAREGGPAAVVLREAARRVGVSATAAYRHFNGQGDLLTEVKNQALGELARAMEEEIGKCEPVGDPRDLALLRLRSAAHAYLGFAFSEPGLFATAFCHDHDHDHEHGAEHSHEHPIPFAGVNAFELLGRLLDELVAVGLMPPARRPMAEFAAWSSVHGLAVLFTDGPLAQVTSEEDRAAAIEYSIEAIVRGLTASDG